MSDSFNHTYQLSSVTCRRTLFLCRDFSVASSIPHTENNNKSWLTMKQRSSLSSVRSPSVTNRCPFSVIRCCRADFVGGVALKSGYVLVCRHTFVSVVRSRWDTCAGPRRDVYLSYANWWFALQSRSAVLTKRRTTNAQWWKMSLYLEGNWRVQDKRTLSQHNSCQSTISTSTVTQEELINEWKQVYSLLPAVHGLLCDSLHTWSETFCCWISLNLL